MFTPLLESRGWSAIHEFQNCHDNFIMLHGISQVTMNEKIDI